MRDLIGKEQAGIVCIQETKFEELRSERCKLLWGTKDIGWLENEAR